VWDAILETLVELRAHKMDSTTVRAHAQAAGGKSGLIQMLLVEAAAAFQQRLTSVQTVSVSVYHERQALMTDALLAWSSQAAKPRSEGLS